MRCDKCGMIDLSKGQNPIGIAEGQYNTGGFTVGTSEETTGPPILPSGNEKLGPLKIMLQLEKDNEFGDSPLRFDITGYSFEMEGLQQGEKKRNSDRWNGYRKYNSASFEHSIKLHRNFRSSKQDRRYD